MNFTTRTHAKWILAGEHAVLRGHPAIVCPLTEKQLTLTWQQTEHPLSIELTPRHDPLKAGLMAILNQECQIRSIAPISGKLCIEHNIPIGRGLGFSAALSVALARLLNHLGVKKAIFALAKDLEDHFHGKSSGLDIAGVLSEQPLFYQKGKWSILNDVWLPEPIWHDGGAKTSTVDCIDLVAKLHEKKPQLAQSIDEDMHQAVLLAQSALQQHRPVDLYQAIRQASKCFQRWGLVTKRMQHVMDDCQKHRHLACKPTGAGLGGMLFSFGS